jgi:hypothetical protein
MESYNRVYVGQYWEKSHPDTPLWIYFLRKKPTHQNDGWSHLHWATCATGPPSKGDLDLKDGLKKIKLDQKLAAKLGDAAETGKNRKKGAKRLSEALRHLYEHNGRLALPEQEEDIETEQASQDKVHEEGGGSKKDKPKATKVPSKEMQRTRRIASMAAISKKFISKNEVDGLSSNSILEAWIEDRLNLDHSNVVEKIQAAVKDKYRIRLAPQDVKQMHDQRCGRPGGATEMTPFNSTAWRVRGPKPVPSEQGDQVSRD